MDDFEATLQALREELDRGVDRKGVHYLRDLVEGQNAIRTEMKGEEALKGLLIRLNLADEDSPYPRDTKRVRADIDHARGDEFGRLLASRMHGGNSSKAAKRHSQLDPL